MTDNYVTRGCLTRPVENTEDGSFTCRGRGCTKMNVFNWLEDIPHSSSAGNMVEVRFKNTRKGYYVNNTGIPLSDGDVIAVEASPGHDIGVVSLTGELVALQMKRFKISAASIKKIYRKAKTSDTEKWFRAIETEPETMRIARQIVANHNLNMKISDVEYQGDKTKATFYYTSEERIDFRQLLKEFADHFSVRIEMKQIGARQEASKVGCIGTCGREICCTSWMSNFASVSTNAARYQELSLNPQKLAGQCGKLKCCLNYELKCYMDAKSDFPDSFVPLETEKGKAYHRKTDIHRRIAWYSFEKDSENASVIPLDINVVKEIINLNRQGITVKELESKSDLPVREPAISYQNAAGEDNISRFEEKRRRKRKKPAAPAGSKTVAPPKKTGEKQKEQKEKRLQPVAENRPGNEQNRPNSEQKTGKRRRGGRKRHHRSENAEEQASKNSSNPKTGNNAANANPA